MGTKLLCGKLWLPFRWRRMGTIFLYSILLITPNNSLSHLNSLPMILLHLTIIAPTSSWEDAPCCLYMCNISDSSYHITSPLYVSQICIVPRRKSVRPLLHANSLLSVTTLAGCQQGDHIHSWNISAAVNNTMCTKPFHIPLGTMQNAILQFIWSSYYGIYRVFMRR